MANVFISYAEEDADIAVGIASHLATKGYSTWYYERDQVAGVSYLKQIDSQIDKCKSIVLVISAQALNSDQITKEVVRGHESRKPFIPLLVGLTHAEFQARQPEWRVALGAAVSIQFSPRNAEDAMKRITAGLSALGIHPEASPSSDPAALSEKGADKISSPHGATKASFSTSQTANDMRPVEEAVAPQQLPRPSAPSYTRVIQPTPVGLQLLVPRPVQFGLQDCFHPTLDWRLNSPLLTAWVCNDHSEASTGPAGFPVAVTVVGEGLPEIRQQLEPAAYAALVQLGTGSMNIITRGFIHLSILGVDDTSDKSSALSKLLALIGVGGASPSTEVAGGDTLKQALASFVKLLHELQETTGFLRIYSYSKSDFLGRLSHLRKQVSNIHSRLPIIVAPQVAQKVMLPFPYPLFRSKAPRFSISLPGNLLKSTELTALIEAYYGSVLTQLTADLERRIEFFSDELTSHRDEVEWFKNLTPENRAKVKDIYANRKVDYDLAIEVEVEGTVVPASKYYLEHLPHVIVPEKEKELQRLEAMRQPLKDLRGKQNSSLWNNCLSRCYDCAIRKVTFSDDDHLNALYEIWRSISIDRVASEFSRVLSDNGLVSTDVLKRTTFFQAVHNLSLQSLAITPYALIDSSRTTVLLELHRNTIQVIDPLDDAYFERGDIEETSNNIDTLLAKLAAAEDEKSVVQEMRNIAFDTPEFSGRICRSLVHQALPVSGISSLGEPVIRRALACSTGARYIRMANNLMRNTADELIAPLWQATDLLPNQALCLLILTCYEEELDPYETIRSLHANLSIRATPRVMTLFRAASADGGEALNYYLLTNAIDREDPRFSAAELVAARIERVLEAIDIFGEFNQGCGAIAKTGESLTTVFIKTASAFELGHKSLWAKPTPTSARIQRYLTGEPLPNLLH